MSLILGLGTALPDHRMNQADMSSSMARALKLDPVKAKRYSKIGCKTAIEHRFSVLSDFTHQDSSQWEFWGPNFPDIQPTLLDRNLRYHQEAPQLADNAVQKALTNWGGDPGDITHVIVVSCTGIMVPGIDVHLVDEFKLNPNVERFGIHFMGCFAALKGLAAAIALCHENPTHRVLVLCIELCSLHFQNSEHGDTLLANLLFADGAAAVVMGNDSANKDAWHVVKRASSLLPDSREFMSWNIGPSALEMHMTKEVPSHIRKHIKSFVHRMTDEQAVKQSAFAIHPGGKTILQSVESACDLKKDQTTASWEVLRDCGNMSSPTVLFILERLLQADHQPEQIVMLGFGPGLTAEGMVLRRGPADQD